MPFYGKQGVTRCGTRKNSEGAPLGEAHPLGKIEGGGEQGCMGVGFLKEKKKGRKRSSQPGSGEKEKA